jgi:hypothetical protein
MQQPTPETKKHNRTDPEYSVSRGIDFQNVLFVINFNHPEHLNPISIVLVVLAAQEIKELHCLS